MDNVVSDERKLEVIAAFVQQERGKRGLSGYYNGHQPEGSCIHNGEANNILFCQLMVRPPEEWSGELNCPEAVDEVYNFVCWFRAGRP